MLSHLKKTYQFVISFILAITVLGNTPIPPTAVSKSISILLSERKASTDAGRGRELFTRTNGLFVCVQRIATDKASGKFCPVAT